MHLLDFDILICSLDIYLVSAWHSWDFSYRKKYNCNGFVQIIFIFNYLVMASTKAEACSK